MTVKPKGVRDVDPFGGKLDICVIGRFGDTVSLKPFEELQEGDHVTFFEWPVVNLEVVEREEDENVGERVCVRAERHESYLYEKVGRRWHYSPEVEADNSPFPVENLRRPD